MMITKIAKSRFRWAFVTVGVLALTLMLGVAKAPAYSLSNTPISQGDFDGFAAGLYSTLTSYFDFFPATTPKGDGSVTSTVYSGENNAAGLYVYTYQVDNFLDNTDDLFTTISWKWGDIAPVKVNVNNVMVDSFYIINSGDGATPDLSSYYTNGSIKEGNQATGLLDGKTSPVFGFFAYAPPQQVQANVLDHTNTIYDPKVLAPVPVPPSVWLLGSGLVGLVGLRRRFWKK